MLKIKADRMNDLEKFGFELDEDYFKSATARLEAAKSQISIFDEHEPTEEWEQTKFI